MTSSLSSIVQHEWDIGREKESKEEQLERWLDENHPRKRGKRLSEILDKSVDARRRLVPIKLNAPSPLATRNGTIARHDLNPLASSLFLVRSYFYLRIELTSSARDQPWLEKKKRTS